VLHGDAADEELLIEEKSTARMCLRHSPTRKKPTSSPRCSPKRLGAHKAIALINKPSYTELVESSSIDIAISPQTVTIGSLLAYVRRGDVRTACISLKRGAAEALEAIVHGDERSSRVVGKMVGQIPLPKAPPSGAVVRGEEVIMARTTTHG